MPAHRDNHFLQRPQGGERSNAKILYVDDEPKALKYFEKIYGKEFEVVVAEDANAALRVLEQPGHRIGVLLTDQRMPRKSGVDLLTEVHAKWPDIVALLITAYLDIEDAISAINKGQIFKYIAKPFAPAQLQICLLEALHEYTKRHATSRLAEAHQQLNEANESKTEFINMLSHEVRTPISITKNLADLLLKTELTETQRQHLTAIKAVNENVANLLDNTLDHSKWQAGELKLAEISFSLDVLLDQLQQTFEAQAELGGVQYRIHDNTGLRAPLRGDRDRLLQVLINLVGNAIKFTPSGGSVTVNASLAEATNEEVVLRFAIADTGIGIDGNALEKLFRPFAQAQQNKKGTGLGLYISRKLVEAMGGEIEVISEPGAGTEFRFVVSLFLAAIDGATVPSDDKSARPILVADDNRINLFYVSKLLSDEGYPVDTADDGREALAKAENKRYATIIVDCQMPHVNGFEVAQRIRSGGCNADTPIVAFTAMSQEAFDERVGGSGINDCIVKPFNRVALIEKIGNWSRKERVSVT